MAVLFGWPLAARAVLQKTGIWLFTPIVIAFEGLGYSDGPISNAWDVNRVEASVIEAKADSRDASDTIHYILDMAWAS